MRRDIQLETDRANLIRPTAIAAIHNAKLGAPTADATIYRGVCARVPGLGGGNLAGEAESDHQFLEAQRSTANHRRQRQQSRLELRLRVRRGF
jgi:hypothetical protein